MVTKETRRPVHRDHRLPQACDADSTGRVFALILNKWRKIRWQTVHASEGITYWINKREQI